MGTQFPFGIMRRVWKWRVLVVHSIVGVHSATELVLNFTLCIFCHNLKFTSSKSKLYVKVILTKISTAE